MLESWKVEASWPPPQFAASSKSWRKVELSLERSHMTPPQKKNGLMRFPNTMIVPPPQRRPPFTCDSRAENSPYPFLLTCSISSSPPWLVTHLAEVTSHVMALGETRLLAKSKELLTNPGDPSSWLIHLLASGPTRWRRSANLVNGLFLWAVFFFLFSHLFPLSACQGLQPSCTLCLRGFRFFFFSFFFTFSPAPRLETKFWYESATAICVMTHVRGFNQSSWLAALLR